ncbi:hypothetical protein GN958_ATG13573, partial [Phytophthora infestans]
GFSVQLRINTYEDDEYDLILELLHTVETSRYTIPRTAQRFRNPPVPYYLYELSSSKFLTNFPTLSVVRLQLVFVQRLDSQLRWDYRWHIFSLRIETTHVWKRLFLEKGDLREQQITFSCRDLTTL